ncbi:MAG TPA: Spy/CpxP family protein refolding chaperone [Ignavibacteriaceae bacterium]|nr:Spy/CpxP family protein refolding chaperone [Ignavibacteriaceae bacterium]
MRLLISSVVATGLIVIFLIVNGCGHSIMHHFSSPEKKAELIVEHISDELDLSKSQEQKLNQIKDEIISKLKENKNKHEELFNTLLAEIKKDKIDEVLLTNRLNEMGKDREEMHSFIVSKLAEFHSILTKEQREVLVQKMNEFKEKFHSDF